MDQGKARHTAISYAGFTMGRCSGPAQIRSHAHRRVHAAGWYAHILRIRCDAGLHLVAACVGCLGAVALSRTARQGGPADMHGG